MTILVATRHFSSKWLQWQMAGWTLYREFKGYKVEVSFLLWSCPFSFKTKMTVKNMTSEYNGMFQCLCHVIMTYVIPTPYSNSLFLEGNEVSLPLKRDVHSGVYLILTMSISFRNKNKNQNAVASHVLGCGRFLKT